MERKFQIVENFKSKNNQESKKFREEGNAKYKKMKIFDAILNYNKAIAFAETVEDLAFAYGNRSAAYFEVGKYEECLKSIELAKEAGFPSDKIKQLNEREEKCEKLIALQNKNPENDLWNYIKLSYPANEKIPWLIEELKMRKTKKYGRGIYATRDLKISDIICIEESNIHALDCKGFYKCCNNCLKTNMMNLIPCLKTASFMFCSTDCLEDFHKYADLTSNKFYKDKFFLNKMENVFGGRDHLFQYFNSNPSNTIFDFDFSNSNSPEYCLNIYKCFLSSKAVPVVAVDGIETDKTDPNEKKLRRIFYEKFLNNAVLMFHCNHDDETHENFQKAKEFWEQYQCVKSCFSTFRALLNHSCVPNIDFVCINNTTIFYAIKPIKKNDQLFIAYDNLNMKDHPEILRSTFGVQNCSCIACVHNISFCNPEREDEMLVSRVYQMCRLNKKICCVSYGMELILTYFDILKNCKKAISRERTFCVDVIKDIFYYLADRLMIPC